jgi:hypothetical protein
LQRLILPPAPGGPWGPWLLRPIAAFRFGASAMMAAISFPFIFRPFKRKWQFQDAQHGTRYDPFHRRPVRRAALYAEGLLLMGIYGIALLFYLLSWDAIGRQYIEQHLPWASRRYSFDQIAALSTLPAGTHSDDLGKSGPWYEVRFRDGRTFDFGKENEGASDAELTAIASFIAARSGHSWQIRADARQ